MEGSKKQIEQMKQLCLRVNHDLHFDNKEFSWSNATLFNSKPADVYVAVGLQQRLKTFADVAIGTCSRKQ